MRADGMRELRTEQRFRWPTSYGRAVHVPHPGRPGPQVCEGGHVPAVHAVVATAVKADGHGDLGIDATSGEDGAGWLAFLSGLVARGLGMQLITSDAHSGLVSTLGATWPGAAWQRSHTHHRQT